jgi:hypothetical protein
MRGFSFNFDTNYGKYVKWAERTKKIMRRKARRLCMEWAQEIVQEAQKRCPEYSDSSTNMNNLTNSIKIAGTEGRYNTKDFGRSRMSVTVGVDADNWQSDYDLIVEDIASASKTGRTLLTSGRELAVLLHESWEQLAGKKARDRADEKGSRYGVRVGSHFLLRAYEENKNALKMQAVHLLEDAAAIKQLRGEGFSWYV